MGETANETQIHRHTREHTQQMIAPKILYFGTPVVLLSTRNADDSANLASTVPGTEHAAPGRGSPLIYDFRHYFGLGTELGHTFRSETARSGALVRIPGDQPDAALWC